MDHLTQSRPPLERIFINVNGKATHLANALVNFQFLPITYLSIELLKQLDTENTH